MERRNRGKSSSASFKLTQYKFITLLMQAIVLYPVAENKEYTTLIKEMLEKTGISKDRMTRELVLSFGINNAYMFTIEDAPIPAPSSRSQISSMSHSKI